MQLVKRRQKILASSRNPFGVDLRLPILQMEPCSPKEGSMRSTATTCLAIWILITNATSNGKGAERPQVIWQQDYEKARAEAQNLSRPILLYFTAKWCPSCLRVERTVFVDKRVVEFVSEQLVAVRIDVDAAPESVETWKVDHLPTAILVSTEGTAQGKIEGYRPAQNYLSELNSLVSAAQQSAAATSLHTNVQPANNAESAGEFKAQPEQDEQIELATRNVKRPTSAGIEILLTFQEEPNLAVNGSCVVSMVDEHRIVSGDPQFSLEFDGSTFWFAGLEQLEKFRADPERYVPVRRGLCVTSLVDEGYEIRGTIHFAAIYRNRLYLFAGPEQRRRFQVSPKRYAELPANSPKT